MAWILHTMSPDSMLGVADEKQHSTFKNMKVRSVGDGTKHVDGGKLQGVESRRGLSPLSLLSLHSELQLPHSHYHLFRSVSVDGMQTSMSLALCQLIQGRAVTRNKALTRRFQIPASLCDLGAVQASESAA